MPKQFDDMVSKVKASLKKLHPDWSEDKLNSSAFAVATSTWKKSHGGKAPSKEKVNDWKVLEFYVPISESVQLENDFFIRGVAINETTTLNNVKYVAEELEKAAHTFRNVPILLDHKNEVRNIVGRTTEKVNYNSTDKRIDFEGKIMDKEIKEMIKDGRIGSVSIGAKVQDLTEEEDGSMKAIGIKGLEISLVAVPGDQGASFAQALTNSFHLKEMAMIENELSECECEECTNKEEKITEEEKVELKEEINTHTEKQLNEKEVTNMSQEEAKIDAKIETVAVENSSVNIAEQLRAEIEELKTLLLQRKELSAQIKEMDKSAVKEDLTKGEVSETVEEIKDNSNLVIERNDSGKLAMYGDYSKDTKLKRLVR